MEEPQSINLIVVCRVVGLHKGWESIQTYVHHVGFIELEYYVQKNKQTDKD